MLLFSKNVFTSVHIVQTINVQTNIAMDKRFMFSLDLLIKARNGRKFRSEEKQCSGKGSTSQKEE